MARLNIEKPAPIRIEHIVRDEFFQYNVHGPKVLAERLNHRLNAIGWWAYAGGHHVAVHLGVPTEEQTQAGERYFLIETD